MKVKSISVFSGGLDSILAVKIISNLGIDVLGVSFETPFFNAKKAITASKQIEMPLEIINITDSYLRMLSKPRYGFGKNMNPCIDCHTMMLGFAGQKMLETGADFIFTGEVLGQRPMSQSKQSLYIVAKNSGFQDYIIRPLSARLLPETKIEKECKVDRNKLYAIQGRGRQTQFKLAKEFGIRDFAAPAGGCLLTDPMFSKRLKDLFLHDENADIREIELLKYGRHLRLDRKTKVIIGRNKDDNEQLEQLSESTDAMLRVKKYAGPIVLITGDCQNETLLFAASLCVLYSDAPNVGKHLVVCSARDEDTEFEVYAANKEDAGRFMI
ncbi:MAG: tRNA 4-thiouridine(8) synthase ThiI [Deltaproteobacteria bacterium]|nr:tRNA 4-thiouridine(8) synthase ThiI [Deltaproteobacteria bacterium]